MFVLVKKMFLLNDLVYVPRIYSYMSRWLWQHGQVLTVLSVKVNSFNGKMIEKVA